MTAVDRAAEMLAAHRLTRTPFPGFPSELRPQDGHHAYAVQDVLHDLLTDRGWGAVVGCKIGCTSRTMQEYLEIDRPAAGGVFASTVRRGEGRFRHAKLVRPGVECELAVRLRSDLDAADAPFGRAEAERAVGGAMAAIEVVEDRYLDWRELGAPTLIADDFFGAGCVLGDEEPDWRKIDLLTVAARMTVNDVEIGSGTGADILGDPLAALVWLANCSAERGRSLGAGTFVLLGSIVQTQWVEPGDVVVVENVPLGTVTARFE